MNAQLSPVAVLFAQWRAIKDECLAFDQKVGTGEPDAEQKHLDRLTDALVIAERALQAAPAQSPEDVLLKLTAISAEAVDLDMTDHFLRLAAEGERVLEAPLRHALHAMQGGPRTGRPMTARQHDLRLARFVEIKGDAMEPTLRRGDFVAVAPVDDFRIDSLYVFDFGFGEIEVKRAQIRPGAGILVFGDNERYWRRSGQRGEVISREQFRQAVIGQVFATCTVTDVSLLETLA